jgi:hypothetical protein
MLRTVSSLAAALALVPAAAASGATATFTGTFEAERSVKYEQPRHIGHTNCRGGHYYEISGSETWKVKSKPFKVVATRGRGGTQWEFGPPPSIADPRNNGVQAAGMVTREMRQRTGTTGGWCGGGEEDPPLPNDCGTRLPAYLVQLSAAGGAVEWTMAAAPWMNREKLEFYKCTLIAPAGLPVGSFPRLPAKVRAGDVFDRGRKTIEIGTSKSYGPETQAFGRTTSGSVRWSLKLTRKR